MWSVREMEPSLPSKRFPRIRVAFGHAVQKTLPRTAVRHRPLVLTHGRAQGRSLTRPPRPEDRPPFTLLHGQLGSSANRRAQRVVVLPLVTHDETRRRINTLAGKNPAGIQQRLRRSTNNKAPNNVAVEKLAARRVSLARHCATVSQ